MKNMKVSLGLLGIATGVVLLTSGCLGDKFEEPYKDAPRSYHDKAAKMDVLQGADGFSNVGSACDGYGGRVFMAYHGDNPYASIDDVPFSQLNPDDPCRSDTSGFQQK